MTVEECITKEADDPDGTASGGGFSLSDLFDAIGLPLGGGIALLLVLGILICVCCCCCGCCRRCCCGCCSMRCPGRGGRKEQNSEDNTSSGQNPVGTFLGGLVALVLAPFGLLGAGIAWLWRRRKPRKATVTGPPGDTQAMNVMHVFAPSGIPPDIQALLHSGRVFFNFARVTPAMHTFLSAPGLSCSLCGSLSAVRVLDETGQAQLRFIFSIDGREFQLVSQKVCSAVMRE